MTLRPTLVTSTVGLLLAAVTPLGGQQATPAAPPVFRSGVNIVLVDVVVRDKKGAQVANLTSNDFQLFEDGKPQQILTFSYEEISNALGIPVGTVRSRLSRARAHVRELVWPTGQLSVDGAPEGGTNE